ncbi:dual specificity tyrosine-phosphorylation-regulated kinase 2-like isoform X1 [Petromyzon marinus]|uniref:dual specificity tyrosine-phosphorylation-regulated kinase 2-like isoform X1 n=1 Tax=Petromyzon marinus TaxID=7757 RepID=UPI003F6F5A73
MDEPVVIAEAGMHFTPAAAMDEPVVIAEAGMHYTPTDILWKFGSRMTPFEHDELTRYKRIYYFKIRQPSQSSFNDVHDFTSHHYNLVQDEHLAYRYQFLSVLGAGGFGQVIRCLDHKHKREVAVKMLQHESYTKPYHSEREVQMLKALQSKEKNNNYVIKLLNTFTFRGHFSLVLELLTGDLRQQLKLAPTAFTLPEAKVYVRSILKALQKLKNKKIIHGDLKPENILIKDQDTSDVRLADFGLSFQECPNVFKRFGTEQYTAPEMYLKLPITCSVDMWSLGCVAAELVTGHHLFNRKLECHHLERVIEILGVPPMTVIVTSKAKLISFGHMGEIFVKNKKVTPESLPLNEVLGTENIHFLNFIKGCLTWDPMWRFTPEDALEHEWMADSSLYLDAEAFLTPSSQAEGTFFTPGNNCGTLSEIDDDSSSGGCGSPDPAASAPSPPASSESVESYVTACEWLREPSGGAIPSASGERGTEKGLREDSSWDGDISRTMSQGNWVPVPCTSKEHRRPDDGRDEDAAATIAAATTVPTISTVTATIATVTATTVPTVPTISTISTVTATTVPTISTISTIATATVPTISTISTVTATTIPTISTIATATTVPTISTISTVTATTPTAPSTTTSVADDDDDDVGSGPTEARRTRRRFAGTRRRFRKFLSFVRNHCCCCTSGEDNDPVTGPAIHRPGDKV